MSIIAVRKATGDDAALLAELSTLTFQETFAADNSPEDMAAYLRESFSVEKIARELADPFSTFFIAEILKKPRGYAKLYGSEPGAGGKATSHIELVRLYVLAESIGYGVGAALMKQCVAEAKRRGFQTLRLGVWEHNARAIRFYERWGFQKVGSHIFQLGSDAQTDWSMEKGLESD